MKTGDMIMNEFGALAEVGGRVEYHSTWKVSGWMITKRNTGIGDGYGHQEFVPDYLLDGSWRKAPMGWDVMPRSGGDMWERWAQRDDDTWFRQLSRSTECPECFGRGGFVQCGRSSTCPTCRGRGGVPEAIFDPVDRIVVRPAGGQTFCRPVETIKIDRNGPL